MLFTNTAPGIVQNINVTCGPVDLINRCTVSWDVSNIDDALFFICVYTGAQIKLH